MYKDLPSSYGTLVDKSTRLHFTFEGDKYVGFKGDNIASALWRNNVKIISRSFKYHRPRGIFSMTGQDANTLVQLPEEGNVIADKYPIKEGLKVFGQHYRGSLKKDRLNIFNLFSRFLPVGFYYRAFYRSDSWNRYWGAFFRKFTGLGVIDTHNSARYYDKKYLFYDVVVVGSGLSGLQASITAGESGAKVLLVEQETILGGSLNYLQPQHTESIRQELIDAVESSDNIKVMLESTCNALYADNWLAIIQHNRLYKTRTKQLLLCTGTFEQPLVFRNNDLPGIMLCTAAQRLMHLYGVSPGNQVVVGTVDDFGYRTAIDLHDSGIKVACVIDYRTQAKSTDLSKELNDKKISIYQGYSIISANENNEGTLRSIEIGNQNQQQHIIECDLLCMHGGYMPSYQLPCHAGAKLQFDNTFKRFEVSNLPANCLLIGSANGMMDDNNRQQDARYQTNQGLKQLGLKAQNVQPATASRHQRSLVLPIVEHKKGKEFIDFDEDLQIADIINAVREGYEDIQLVKRFSTLGMGPSQGRYSSYTSNLLIAHHDKQKTIDQIGVTTARPPFAAEKIGHLAGRNFYPERHSSMHHRHVELGAQPLLAGAWIRPAYYGAKDDMVNCVRTESLNVHHNVGVIDVSTLGGIEIRGPDAAEFIHRMYTWNYLKQPVGKARYVLLTNEAGTVIDDGVACRFGEQHFYVTATTGGVDNVYLQFLKWNAQWRLRVDIANVTSAWCGVNVAGPNSRKVLAKICQDVDLSAQAFPYIGVRQGMVANIPARLIRVGFVGELGYEVHVPQHCGEALWDAIMEAGKEFDIKPFGVETQRLLRLEKGHIIIGQDTDATAYPEEINMSWAVGKNKPFFIGQRSINILNSKKPTRQLIGYTIDHGQAIVKESHLCFNQNNRLIGRVTSVGQSAILDKTIGMALIEPEHSAVDSRFIIRADNTNVQATVVPLPFYDAENKRQEM